MKKESCQVVPVAGSGQVWARGLVVCSSYFCLEGVKQLSSFTAGGVCMNQDHFH